MHRDRCYLVRYGGYQGEKRKYSSARDCEMYLIDILQSEHSHDLCRLLGWKQKKYTEESWASRVILLLQSRTTLMRCSYRVLLPTYLAESVRNPQVVYRRRGDVASRWSLCCTGVRNRNDDRGDPPRFISWLDENHEFHVWLLLECVCWMRLKREPGTWPFFTVASCDT